MYFLEESASFYKFTETTLAYQTIKQNAANFGLNHIGKHVMKSGISAPKSNSDNNNNKNRRTSEQPCLMDIYRIVDQCCSQFLQWELSKIQLHKDKEEQETHS